MEGTQHKKLTFKTIYNRNEALVSCEVSCEAENDKRSRKERTEQYRRDKNSKLFSSCFHCFSCYCCHSWTWLFFLCVSTASVPECVYCCVCSSFGWDDQWLPCEGGNRHEFNIRQNIRQNIREKRAQQDHQHRQWCITDRDRLYWIQYWVQNSMAMVSTSHGNVEADLFDLRERHVKNKHRAITRGIVRLVVQ